MCTSFQSLGRDSVGWDLQTSSTNASVEYSFNPSVGILWGGTRLAYPVTLVFDEVSIPRSGFCGVGPRGSVPSAVALTSFNPSVGILWGGTTTARTPRGGGPRFQSLGRDSVGWDMFDVRGRVRLRLGFNPSVGILWGGTRQAVLEGAVRVFVSIPRSGFCGVGLGPTFLRASARSEFQSLGRDSVGWDGAQFVVNRLGRLGFNPSVGILWGGTSPTIASAAPEAEFQSLGRDSVGWDSL